MPGVRPARPLLVGCVLLVLSSCSDAAPAPVPAPRPAPSAHPSGPDPGASAAAVVHHPDAGLAGVMVENHGGRRTVTSGWVVNGRREVTTAVTTSDDGFHTSTSEIVPPRNKLSAVQPRRPTAAPDNGSCAQVAGGVDVCSRHGPGGFALQWTGDGGGSWDEERFGLPGMLGAPEDSLRRRTIATVLGGDGATLLPFDTALRSRDLGATWETFDLPTFGGETAFVSGSVVLPDGRLLALLGAFSGDRRIRPSDVQHGLYVSDGDDWSSYSVLRPRFDPPLKPTPQGRSPLAGIWAQVRPDPMILASTTDHRVYVSTDEAATFREIRVR